MLNLTSLSARVCIAIISVSHLVLLTDPSSCIATPPNIVVIMVDDLGYSDIGCYGGEIDTPNLDALAANGVALRNHFAAPICSPTRSSLMTGRYTIRLGTQANTIYHDVPWGISLKETFLPQNLREAGYLTALFGKW